MKSNAAAMREICAALYGVYKGYDANSGQTILVVAVHISPKDIIRIHIIFSLTFHQKYGH